MIQGYQPVVLLVLVIGAGLLILLPLAVVGVAIRGYRRTDGNATALHLATGIVLVTALPTLMRLGFGAIVPGGTWTPLVIRLTELAGLLIVLKVMHGD